MHRTGTSTQAYNFDKLQSRAIIPFARKIQITDFNDSRGSYFNIYSFWVEMEIFLFEIKLIRKVTTLLRLNRKSLRLFCDHTADMSYFVSDCSDMLCSLLTVTSTVFHLKVPLLSHVSGDFVDSFH